MKIFIMRHGEAQLLAATDSERHLTERGERQAYAQGQWLREQEIRFDKVLVSPYVRAQETLAQINRCFAGELAAKSENWDALTPYGNAAPIRDYLALLAQENNHQCLLLVSHLPLVGEIVAELCGNNPVGFNTATLVQIEWDGKLGRVEKVKSP
ncbi:phosphohistidine phosphatase SixA [Mesocricetibacter intestinalis]|uniref:phosphohistidine phosphatase SixA n=1 Tax=Mesocricetibacter intestinalis TaxID=1521930 RepID=UPI00105EC6E5|nr:phosphohistidine phosphatase SixA [Mesocricetibacter intestinalis]